VKLGAMAPKQLPDWVVQLTDDKASKPESWPPKSDNFFDWENWTTHEAYHDPQETEFTPKFSLARSRLDYSYHRKPAFTRQELQDAILSRVVSAATEGPSQSGGPWIVFTAGPMGVGKGYVLSTLHQSSLFPLEGFLKIDPDMLKMELPEMSGYLRADPESAATKIHRESTQMADVLFEYALINRIPALVDGSLRDVDFHRSLFKRIRSDFPEFRIAIIHVTANPVTIYERAKKRAERTGRAVPTELLDQSIEQVPRSIKLLSPDADAVFEISNEDGSPISLVNPGVSWDDFASTWKEMDKLTGATSDSVMKAPKKTFTSMRRKSMPARLCNSMASCWTNKSAQDVAQAIWGKAYPNFCPRCALVSDGQCGVCVHGKHLCACEECDNVCPVRKSVQRPVQRRTTIF
jgi:hypothetical protein